MKSSTVTKSPLEFAPFVKLAKYLRRFTQETRTRILLLYAITLTLLLIVSAPIFRFYLFEAVNERVREDLREEFEDFQTRFEDWETSSLNTDDALKGFIDTFLTEQLPEDDNFHIFILDGQFYRSNPIGKPDIISSDSLLMQEWLATGEATEVTLPTTDSAIGSILYKTQPLEIDGEPRGLFVVAHLSAGERTESLTGVYIFVRIALVVSVAAFLLAWFGSRELLKPVQQLSMAAQELNEANLSRRLQVQGSGELATLANTFNAMMNRVQEAFDSQHDFINDAGHELRTPITIIQGHLELMGDDPEEQQKTIELVMEELERMGRFVNDIILLAKAERPDFLQLETVDLQVFTETIFSKVVVLCDRDWQLNQVGQGKVVIDPQRLTGALINLVQNAIQHTQPADTIEFGSAIAQEHIRLWVRDTGEGIAVADQERIFDRFARAANSYRRSEGAGLGLAIVEAITDAHHGHVELISKPDVGSTFTLVLPLISDSEN